MTQVKHQNLRRRANGPGVGSWAVLLFGGRNGSGSLKFLLVLETSFSAARHRPTQQVPVRWNALRLHATSHLAFVLGARAARRPQRHVGLAMVIGLSVCRRHVPSSKSDRLMASRCAQHRNGTKRAEVAALRNGKLSHRCEYAQRRALPLRLRHRGSPRPPGSVGLKLIGAATICGLSFSTSSGFTAPATAARASHV